MRVIDKPLGRRPVIDPRGYRVTFTMTAEQDSIFRDATAALGLTVSEAGEQAVRLWIDRLRIDLLADRAKRRKTAKPAP